MNIRGGDLYVSLIKRNEKCLLETTFAIDLKTS